MPKFFLVIAVTLFLILGAGCAKFVRFEIPDEFKKKKLKEDPPISMIQPTAPEGATKEA